MNYGGFGVVGPNALGSLDIFTFELFSVAVWVQIQSSLPFWDIYTQHENNRNEAQDIE
jgi:hypothetical protein